MDLVLVALIILSSVMEPFFDVMSTLGNPLKFFLPVMGFLLEVFGHLVKFTDLVLVTLIILSSVMESFFDVVSTL